MRRGYCKVMKKTLFFVLLAAGLLNAAHLAVTEPVAATVDQSGVLDLGLVGPGQKLEIVADRASGATSTIGGEALWDKLSVDADSLPQGWTREDGRLYESPMRAFVSIARDAPDGDYYFNLKAFDEYEGAPTLIVECKITVSKNVLDVAIGEGRVSAGVGQPAVFHFVLKNKSSAADSFKITATGIPGGWVETKRVFLPHNSNKPVTYSIVSSEAGEYDVKFNVESLSSDAISSNITAKLRAERDLYRDMQATSHGILLFPSVQQAVYALFGLVTNLK